MILSMTRKVGSLLRGKATPFQLISACVLGALIGFAPVPSYEKGLLLMPLWVALLVVLNANLFLAGLVAALCKTLSLALLPVSFEAGKLLLDGPGQGLMASLINGPVTAWMGLEYYVTSGGVLVAVVLGVGLGAGAVVLLNRFRLVMTKAEEGSPKFQKLSQNKGMKCVSWLLFGKRKAKMTYRELIDRHKKVGLPVRPLGVAVVVLLVVAAGLASMLLEGRLVKAVAVSGLERLSGATVDLERVEIDKAGGRIELIGLAFADPDDLSADWMRADRLSAAIDTKDLLSKRFVLDHAEMEGVLFDVPRERPGSLVRPAPKPAPAPPESEPEAEPQSDIDKWLARAQEWKDRLERYEQWIQRFRDLVASRGGEEAPAEAQEDRLKRWAEDLGYANVRATHLVQSSPRFLIRRLTATEIPLDELPGDETLGVEAANLSTDPQLLEVGPSIRATSSGQTLDVSLALHSLAKGAQPDALAVSIDRWPLQERVEWGPLELGDRVSGTLDGAFDEKDLDLTLDLRPHDAALEVSGTRLPLGDQSLPVLITGALSSPKVRVDYAEVQRSVTGAVTELGRERLQEADARLREEQRKLEERVRQEAGEAAGDALGGFLDRARERVEQDGGEGEDPLSNLLPPGLLPGSGAGDDEGQAEGE